MSADSDVACVDPGDPSETASARIRAITRPIVEQLLRQGNCNEAEAILRDSNFLVCRLSHLNTPSAFDDTADPGWIHVTDGLPIPGQLVEIMSLTRRRSRGALRVNAPDDGPNSIYDHPVWVSEDNRPVKHVTRWRPVA